MVLYILNLDQMKQTGFYRLVGGGNVEGRLVLAPTTNRPISLLELDKAVAFGERKGYKELILQLSGDGFVEAVRHFSGYVKPSREKILGGWVSQFYRKDGRTLDEYVGLDRFYGLTRRLNKMNGSSDPSNLKEFYSRYQVRCPVGRLLEQLERFPISVEVGDKLMFEKRSGVFGGRLVIPTFQDTKEENVFLAKVILVLIEELDLLLPSFYWLDLEMDTKDLNIFLEGVKDSRCDRILIPDSVLMKDMGTGVVVLDTVEIMNRYQVTKVVAENVVRKADKVLVSSVFN